MYLSLYRKWRPKRFDEMVGQDHVAQAMKNAFIANKLAHAYLFTGSRGTGKTTAAKLLAKLVNCANPTAGEPCNVCEACLNSNQGHEELSDIYEIDAASNRGIDEIRELRENIKFSPLHHRKVYIIDEVHMLTNEAFNALLKTLEDPPSHVIFILATTDPRKIPATVLSRCQRFDFRRLEEREIVGQLGFIAEQEGFQVEEAALNFLAMLAEGGLRDAISLLDQCATAFDGKVDFVHVRNLVGGVGDDVLLELLASGLQGELAKVLEIIDNLAETGANLSGVGQDFSRLLRDLIYAKVAPHLLEGKYTEAHIRNFTASAANISSEILGGGIKLFLETENILRYATDPRIVFEAALIEFTMIASGKPIATAGELGEMDFSTPDHGILEKSHIGKDKIALSAAMTSLAPAGASDKTLIEKTKVKVNEPPSAVTPAKSMDGGSGKSEKNAVAAELNRRWQQLALKQKSPILRTMLRQCTVTGQEGNKLVLFTQNPSAADRLLAKREEVLPLLGELAPGLIDYIVSEAKTLEKASNTHQESKLSFAKHASLEKQFKETPNEEPVIGIVLREFEGTDVSDEFQRKDDGE
jgi:DNA polymerase-3 subunit gamma/tau